MKYMIGLLLALLCMPLSAQSQETPQDEWEYSVGARVWYASWDRKETADITNLSGPTGNQSAPSNGNNQQAGTPGAPGRSNESAEADALPFTSIYFDAFNGPWRVGIAAGLSSEYEFRNGRSEDNFERTDLQILLERRINDWIAGSVGLHRISNRGNTDGQDRGVESQSFKYSFTGPEATLGGMIPLYHQNDKALAATASGTFGYYMVDNTAGFDTTLDDTAGATWDIGLNGLWQKIHMKAGYRALFINDSIWSIDRLSETSSGLQREKVDTSETFEGVYLELSYDF